MESTGEEGRIQVTKSAAEVLQTAGYCCTFRGEILVKGKGVLPTYWVARPAPSPCH